MHSKPQRPKHSPNTNVAPKLARFATILIKVPFLNCVCSALGGWKLPRLWSRHLFTVCLNLEGKRCIWSTWAHARCLLQMTSHRCISSRWLAWLSVIRARPTMILSDSGQCLLKVIPDSSDPPGYEASWDATSVHRVIPRGISVCHASRPH